MPDDTQDAGRRATPAPRGVRIEGKKILAEDGQSVGTWLDGTLIGDAAVTANVLRELAAAPEGAVLACWSGSPAATPEDPFPDDPGAWSPAAWATLDEAISRMAPALVERGVLVLIRPHHRHVVGDVPSVGRLTRSLGERGIGGVGVLLDAEAMLADSMRARDADDHRRRIREALRPVARFEIV